MTNQNLLNKRKHYYNKLYVQYELLKCMRDREVSFIDTDYFKRDIVRGIFIRNISSLQNAFKIFGFFRKNFNIYISVAKYKHIPVFTPNLKERSNQTWKWFNEVARNDIKAYDFLIDLDSGDIKNFPEMKSQTLRIIKSLKINNIVFYFYPSGNNFQIIIPSEYIPPIMNRAKTIIDNMRNELNLKFVDNKGIGTFNKLMKCPYSLVNDKVCLPINSIEYFDKRFNYNDMDSNNILGSINIKARGLCEFNLINAPMSAGNFINYIYDYKLNKGLDLEGN